MKSKNRPRAVSRLLSFLLAAVMASGMVMPAFAEEPTEPSDPPPAPTAPAEPTELKIALSTSSLNLALEAQQKLEAPTLEFYADGVKLDAAPAGGTEAWSWTMDGNTGVAEMSDGETARPTLTGKQAGTISLNGSLVYTFPKESGGTGSLTASTTVAVTVAAAEATGVSVSPTKLIIDVDNKSTISATVSPSSADQVVTWKSDNVGIATVDGTGEVTGIRSGTTIITATTANGKTATCEVAIKGVTVSVDKLSMVVGETKSLTAESHGGISTTYLWDSTKPDVAGVDTSGRVIGRAAGTTIITVTATGTDYKASCTVEVTENTADMIMRDASIANPLNFSDVQAEMNSQCERVLGSELKNVTGLSVPTSTGILFYGYQSADENGLGVGTTDVFSYNDAAGMRKLSNITFVPNTDFSGTTEIQYTGNSSAGRAFRGVIRVNVDRSNDVTYSVSAGQAVHFTADSFNKICQNRTGGTLNYVKFSTPSSDRGTLYMNYRGSADYDSKVTSDQAYYRMQSPKLEDIAFVPNENYTGTFTIPYTGYGSGNSQYSGRVTIVVSGGGSSGDISYTVGSRGYVQFASSDFQTFCRNQTQRNLDYVRFTLPSSNQGTLYYKYRSSGSYDREVSSSTNYYRNSSYYLSDVYFVPKSNFSGTCSISFTAYDTSGERISGIVSVKANGDDDDDRDVGDITYSCAKNGSVSFQASDFNRESLDHNNYNLNYVKFTLPSSTRGTLYYKYSSSNSNSTKVSSSTNYYRNSSAYLDDVTFVAYSGYTGNVDIDYTGYDTNGERFTGTVTVKVGSSSSGDLSYTVRKNSSVRLDVDDFNTYSKDYNGYNIDYVKFTLPSSSKGTLYYDYASSSSYGNKVSSSTSYYRNSSPYIKNISFVPDRNYTGTVDIDFTGYDTNGGRVTGTVNIEVGDGTADDTVAFKTVTGKPITFDADKFNAVSQNHNDRNFSYVKFSLPSTSQGTLYYNYKSDGKYDSKVSSSTSYYRASSPYVYNITFVPAEDYSGTASFEFTGYDSSSSKFTGRVQVEVQKPTVETVNYSSAGTPVAFRTQDFHSVSRALMGEDVSKVRFTPPSSSEGKLYFRYTGPNQYESQVSSNTEYYANNSPELSRITFVPAPGYSGTVSIAYSGEDTKGFVYSGTVEIAVQASTNNANRFTDMGDHAWAVQAVEYLYASKVVNGTSTSRYSPEAPTSRGDFALMIVRAFNFQTAASGQAFPDVPTNSYYAQAIQTARSLDIVEGAGGRFQPDAPVSRQDAMLMLQRAMRSAGWALDEGAASDLVAYQDANQVAGYAAGAVGTMVRLGVVQGDNRDRLTPNAPITRAEMAVILYRALTL